MDNVKRILDSILRHNPELQTRVRESKSVSQWEAAVGPQIAKHSRVFKVENGVLFVEVDHPAWRSELHHRKLQILERLNAVNEGEGTAVIQDLFFMEPRSERLKESSSNGGSRPGKAPPKNWGSPSQPGKNPGTNSPGITGGKSGIPSKSKSRSPSKR